MENGFTPLTVGCPILIGDGLKGTDDVAVPVEGGEYVKEAKIGRAVMDADVFISLSTSKAMNPPVSAAQSRTSAWAAAPAQAKRNSTPTASPASMHRSAAVAAAAAASARTDGLVFNAETGKMTVDLAHCVGCGRCLGACNFDAIQFTEDNAVEVLNYRMAEYA